MRIDAEKLRAELYRRCMTQIALADMAGISHTTIAGVANGKSCSKKTAERIAATLGIKLEELGVLL